MRRHGLAGQVRVIAGDHTEAAGSRAARALLDDGALPSAVVAYNDSCALGLLDTFNRAGVEVPAEVSVAGYDDSSLARLAHVNLTTVSQDARGQAEHALAAAVERLDGGRVRPREVVLPPRLVVRGTTGPPPAAGAYPGGGGAERAGREPGPGNEPVSERDRYTPEEWRTLQFAPFWMFGAVVGAYNRFDPRDVQVFMRCLEVATLGEGRLRRELLESVLADRDRLAERFHADPRTIGVGLFQVDLVLRRAGDDEAALFKDMLVLDVGEGVARARGRYGTEMSEDDARAVALAAQLLGVERYPVDDL